jgi:hypothetical protein
LCPSLVWTNTNDRDGREPGFFAGVSPMQKNSP